jgi:predicted nucleic acid-binding protein
VKAFTTEGLLIDTNVLLRLADELSTEHALAMPVLEKLLASGVAVYLSAQVLVEFWAVATRPVAANGLGWSNVTAVQTIRALRGQFPLLHETPDGVDRWLELVDRCQVSGKHAHDARLASLVIGHGMRKLLTFNTSDFPPAWGIEAIHPEQITANSPPP